MGIKCMNTLPNQDRNIPISKAIGQRYSMNIPRIRIIPTATQTVMIPNEVFIATHIVIVVGIVGMNLRCVNGNLTKIVER